MFQGNEEPIAADALPVVPVAADDAPPPIKAAADTAATFVCPGSETPISRSVHLSRLRRGFEECRECPQREQIGHLSSPAVRAFVANDESASTLLRRGAIRGTYLNELTRPVMAGLAEAVASMLWDDLGGMPTLTAKPCPVVVVGRDTRPMSADLAAGAVAGLRRMGCHVIEVGEVTRPEFWFAARHLESFAGVWINGVGADANCSGLDVVQGGRCWSSPGRLDDLLQRKDNNLTRPRERNGTLATFQTARPYLAGLRKHFHAFRPLTILFSCRERMVEGYLKSLLEESPIQSHWDEQGRLSELQSEASQLSAELMEQLLSQRLDAVIAINEDAQSCRIWDERGRPVSPLHMLRPMLEVIDRRRLARTSRQSPGTLDTVKQEVKRQGPNWLQARAAFVRSQGGSDGSEKAPQEVVASAPVIVSREDNSPREAEHIHTSPIVVSTALLPENGSLGTDVISAESTLEAMSRAMVAHEARLGLDWRGAFWFDEAGPTSDALITTARVLQLLSQSDHPLSRLWAE